jgi:hypothetical protein
MTQVREMDADLMLAAGAGNEAQQRETFPVARKFLFNPKFRLRKRAIEAHAVLDGDAACFILAKWRVNDPLLRRHMAVDNGDVFFFNGAAFQNFSQFAGDFGIFGDNDHAAGFTVEAVDEVWLNVSRLSHLTPALSPADGGEGGVQINPRAANEAGHFAILGRMTDEAGGFVNDQQIVIFKNDVEQVFHFRRLFLGQAGVSSPPVKEKWHRWLPVVFVALFAVSRIPGLLPWNFSAAYAFAFCAGVYFPRKNSWWLPLLIFLGTDIGLNCYYSSRGIQVWDSANLKNLLFNYLAYATLIFLGRRFKPQSSFVALLGGGLLGAILFYLITNTASWFFNPFHNPEYAKTISAWLLALTKGIGGYPSTWEFFRNTLLSGGLFTALFVAAAKLTAPAESPADKKAGTHDEEPEAEKSPEEAGA